ncbi:rap1 GTPase-activating protein 1 isoform B [Columba livia]|nr:rap1 GTPase-activating protein 1 isoform B [Columba livia]
MLHYPLDEEPFPHVQPEPPLAHLPAVPLGSVIGHQREEISACLSFSPCEEAVEPPLCSVPTDGMRDELTLNATRPDSTDETRFQSQPEMMSPSLDPLCQIQPYLERVQSFVNSFWPSSSMLSTAAIELINLLN